MSRCLIFLLSAILFTLLVFADGFPCVASQPSLLQPVANKGILDLRNENFKTHPILINGQWKFYWNSLETPLQPDTYYEFAEFPKLWEKSTWKKQEISSQGFASYKLKILLPKATSQLP